MLLLFGNPVQAVEKRAERHVIKVPLGEGIDFVLFEDGDSGHGSSKNSEVT